MHYGTGFPVSRPLGRRPPCFRSVHEVRRVYCLCVFVFSGCRLHPRGHMVIRQGAPRMFFGARTYGARTPRAGCAVRFGLVRYPGRGTPPVKAFDLGTTGTCVTESSLVPSSR